MSGSSRAETIGERLRRLRLARGLSQRQLSEPGVSYAYISRVEGGSRQPSVKTLRKVARKLGVSVEYLETGRDIAPRDDLELRISDAELRLRLLEDTRAAEETLRELAAEADEAGDPLSSARARSALGLAALRDARLSEAVELLESAVASGATSPVLQPELYGFLGRAYAGLGRAQLAADLFERCLREVEQALPDGSDIYVRFAVYLSYALSDLGETDRAQRVLEDAAERAGPHSDPYMQVRLYWSQSRLAATYGEPRLALSHLRRAIALLEATEDRRQLGRAHVLWAEIVNTEGRAGEAGPHLAEAESLLGAQPDAEDAAWLMLERAVWAAEVGDAGEAVTLAERALESGTLTDPAERGTAHLALAKAAAAAGEVPAAGRRFREATALLEEGRSWRRASRAYTEWAAVLRTAGLVREAEDVSRRAAGLAARAVPHVAGEAPSR